MTSRSRVETRSSSGGGEIRSLSDAESTGDTPHAEYIAGLTAGAIGKGHASAHADYLGKVAEIEAHYGRSHASPGSGGGGSPLGELNSLISIMKSLGGI